MSRIVNAVLIFTLAGLSACAPQKMPAMKIGNPYVVDGKTYYPSYDSSYDKIGDASWYGPGFHGKYTASGEVYDQHDYTAAHPTLPMPSLVRVTNLSNGKSLLVRINDRGPFAANRIIDLSKDSAKALGIKGVARVRVQFLEKETQYYLAMVQQNNNRIVSMTDFAARLEQQQALEQMAMNIDEDGEEAGTSDTQEIVSEDVPPLAVPVTMDKPKKTALIREAMAEEPVDEPQPLTTVLDTNDAIGMTLKPSSAPTSKPAAVVAEAEPAGGGIYAIQLGSFASEINANKLVEKLADIAQANVRQVEVKGRMWWQVRIHGFNDREDAGAVLQQVRAAGVPEARIVHQ